MAVTYMEASAITKLILPEVEQAPLIEYLRDAPSTVTSLLSVVEVQRATTRSGSIETERVRETLSGLAMLHLDREVIDAAATLGPTTLPTLDAIHLASAQILGSDLHAFVTYDRRLADAARAVGLPVVSPGV